MSIPRRVNIPQRHYLAFSLIIGLSEDEYHRLVSSLVGASKILVPEELVSALSSDLAIELGKARNLVETLLNLHSLRGSLGLSVEEMADDLTSALEDARDTTLRPTENNRGMIQQRITTLLGMREPIGIITKVLTLREEYNRRFVEAHIATDLRPIFKDDLEAPLAAAMITHVLRLNYSEDGEVREFYIAFTPSEIEELRAVLDRADLKAKSLAALLETTAVPVLGELT